ncbi:MAG: hypothetical protein Q4F05_11560 [bacterium]|nr:hypothetical protein [bacterium]
MNLPIQAFCLKGYGKDKVVLTIDRILGYPESTSYEGGYDVVGRVEIQAGNYYVTSEKYIFATGTLYRFVKELQRCYKTLNGVATYQMLLENELIFRIEMGTGGHATIIGTYQERPDVENILNFEMQTDQTYFNSVIQDIEKLKKIFGDFEGKIE